MTNKLGKILLASSSVAALVGGVAACGGTHSSMAPPAPTPAPVSSAPASPGLPRADLTPGETSPAVTQANIKMTICVPGYSSSIRPPVAVTNKIKTERMRVYGYSASKSLYELDHLIPLSLGGAPRSLNNLWPELRTGTHGAVVKDGFEAKIHAAVCAGKVPLVEAQKAMAVNWEAAYAKYFPGSAAK